jgi:hypothetical protein
MAEPADHRPALEPPPWVPLLRRLTEISPVWGVWKNADAAISGKGDIDSISPPADRSNMVEAFREWARDHDFRPVFICHHLPGSVVSVALRGERELVELQLCERAMYRGSTLFQVEDLAPMMVMDRRGFRRLREGSEGLLLLFHNGLRWGGRPAMEAIERKDLPDMMRRDPEGMEAATSVFGPRRGAALRLARAVLDARWDRRAALEVEAWAVARGPSEPRLWLSRATYRMRGGRCPLLPVLRSGRRIPGDVGGWLERAELAH